MIDSHCHLTSAKLAGDVDEVLERARAAGVTSYITIGTGVDDAGRVLELSRRFPGVVFPTAGLDPFSSHAAGAAFDDELAAMTERLEAGGFVAVGEIGLDYHYDLDPRPVQADRFERQLDLAVRLGLPVVIHVREAHEDMAAILSGHPRNQGVIHSFTGRPEDALRYLSLGWHLAFNGVLTFKNADDVRAAARLAPIERVLIETDSPYLAPFPKRGARCEPAFLPYTLRTLAEVRGEAVDALEEATTANARALFGLTEAP